MDRGEERQKAHSALLRSLSHMSNLPEATRTRQKTIKSFLRAITVIRYSDNSKEQRNKL
jgi:hypothetical protein